MFRRLVWKFLKRYFFLSFIDFMSKNLSLMEEKERSGMSAMLVKFWKCYLQSTKKIRRSVSNLQGKWLESMSEIMSMTGCYSIWSQTWTWDLNVGRNICIGFIKFWTWFKRSMFGRKFGNCYLLCVEEASYGHLLTYLRVET